MNNLITSIDLGTSKVCVIIGKIDDYGYLQIIGVGSNYCEGIRKGIVVDIESTTMAISYALEQAENMADVKVSSAYISIPGGYTKLVRNKGIIAVSGEDKEISPDDVRRVLNSATIFSMPQDQQIIDIIPFQYIVDGFDEIKEPVGMVGIRLEADVDIIIGSTTTVLNLIKSINHAGLEVLGIVSEPFAVADVILSKDERELGVLLIDIGAGTTDYSLFKNNQLIYNNIIPVAGNHISNDISVGLRISSEESEKLKQSYGVAYAPLADVDKKLTIEPIGFNEKMDVTEFQLSQIIEARLEEIFQLINDELVRNNIKDEVLTGVVITGGGGGYYKGITDLATEIFRLPARVGQPDFVGVREPVYSTGVGLITYSLNRKFNYFIEYDNMEIEYDSRQTSNDKGLFTLIRNFWEEYF